jgi:hypothetical protein
MTDGREMNHAGADATPNKLLHLTVIPLRSIPPGELYR